MNIPDLIKNIVKEVSYLIHSREIIFGAYMITYIEHKPHLFKELKKLCDEYGAHVNVHSTDLHSELNSISSVLNTPVISNKIPDVIIERAETVQRLVEEGYGPEIHALYISLLFDRKDIDEGLIDDQTIMTVQERAQDLLENSDYLYLSFD